MKKEVIKYNILIVLGYIAAMVLIFLLLFWAERNYIQCLKPATQHWKEQVNVCIKSAANSYNSRCEEYQEVTRYRSNAVWKTSWKQCEEGFIRQYDTR